MRDSCFVKSPAFLNESEFQVKRGRFRLRRVEYQFSPPERAASVRARSINDRPIFRFLCEARTATRSIFSFPPSNGRNLAVPTASLPMCAM
jgi:hypothetical protein